MFGFLALGTTMTMVDLAFKNRIDSQKDEEFPKELEGSKGKILLYKNHTDGFSFGVLRGSKLVELVPLCLTSGIAGVWTYLMSVRGRWAEKFAITFVLALCTFLAVNVFGTKEYWKEILWPDVPVFLKFPFR